MMSTRTQGFQDNCPPDCPTDNCSPRTITPEDNCPRGKLASDNCSPHNYPRGKISPGQLSPRKFGAEKLPPPLTIKFPSKIIAPTHKFPPKSTTSELRKTMHCLRVMQFRSKKLFASIYFIQILTKSCRKPLTREHISLNAS